MSATSNFTAIHDAFWDHINGIRGHVGTGDYDDALRAALEAYEATKNAATEVTKEMKEAALDAWADYWGSCNDANVAGSNEHAFEAIIEAVMPMIAAPQPPAVEPLPQSSAPPALYQHDDGRYALALGDVARHKLTDSNSKWHRVPLDVVVTGAEGEEVGRG